ncbi:hypothetical protein BA6E_106149 [Bacteroidales bacterium 6E]|nr:hypothetical protein BA6E_106149 [Bacteroidales bacterium 6E]
MKIVSWHFLEISSQPLANRSFLNDCHVIALLPKMHQSITLTKIPILIQLIYNRFFKKR